MKKFGQEDWSVQYNAFVSLNSNLTSTHYRVIPKQYF